MTALDTMKSALQCAKTEAAELRIRVRQLEEKLVDAAAVSERETEALRQGADVLVTENARLVAANTRLRVERDGAMREYERMRESRDRACENARRHARENTPLVAAVRRVLELKAPRGDSLSGAAMRYCPACATFWRLDSEEMHGRECPVAILREALSDKSPAVDGTGSDNSSVRQLGPCRAQVPDSDPRYRGWRYCMKENCTDHPAGGSEQDRGAAAIRPAGSHAFIPAPFYPDKCDATLDDRGRQRTCARPRAEHAEGGQ